MNLPAEDQRHLAAILQRLHGTQDDLVPGGAVPTVIETDGAGALQEWISSLAGLSPYQRLAALDEALQDANDAERQVLGAARREILAEHPALAVRLAVERLVTERPLASLLGLAGIVLALTAAARGVFRLLF